MKLSKKMKNFFDEAEEALNNIYAHDCFNPVKPLDFQVNQTFHRELYSVCDPISGPVTVDLVERGTSLRVFGVPVNVIQYQNTLSDWAWILRTCGG